MTSRRRTAVLLALTLAVGAAATNAVSSGIAASSEGDAVASRLSPVSRGSLDANVRLASGRLLGELHGSVHRFARGKAKFQPRAGSKRPAEIVGLRVRRVGGRELIRARASGLRLTLRISRQNRLVGAGRIDGRRVRVRGAGGERTPHLSARKRMLVVGHPRGVGYAALKRRYRAVRYRPRRHHRHRFLRERRQWRSYAAIVFGPDVSASAIRRHRLLHSFYSAGRYVVLAPARANRLAAVSALHPHVVTRPAPAIAVRSVGVEGGVKRTRPTIVYPTARRPRRSRIVRTASGEIVHLRLRPPSRAARRASKRRRARWFAGQLRGNARAYRAARRGTGAQAAQSAPINVPDNAALLEIPVFFYHDNQTIGSRNLTDNPLCGVNRTNGNTWCPDTWYWKQLSDAWGDPLTACINFRAKGYAVIHQSAVDRSRGVNADGAYKFDLGTTSPYYAFSSCPYNWSTSQIIQGTDTYYALFSADPDTHLVLVKEDVTITPTSNANGAGGSKINSVNGSGTAHYCLRALPSSSQCQSLAYGRPLLESFYLGRYDRSITLSGAETNNAVSQFTDPEHPDAQSHLVYSGGLSAPDTVIEQTEESAGKDYTKGFDVGVFGDQGTLSYNQSTTTSFNTTVSVPNWVVEPDPEFRRITWSWKNNRPVSFDVASAHQTSVANQTFAEGNQLNSQSFTPQSLAVWSGPPVWGRIGVDSSRVLYMIDHFSRYNPAAIPDDFVDDMYSITSWSLADGPNTNTPSTGTRNDALSPGINFCDPEVRAPVFKDTCADAYAALITLTGACATGVTGSFTALSVNGTAPKAATGTSTSSLGCGQTAHASVRPKTPATLRFTAPAGSVATVVCRDAANAGAGNLAGPTASPAIVGSEQVTPRRRIACTITATK